MSQGNLMASRGEPVLRVAAEQSAQFLEQQVNERGLHWLAPFAFAQRSRWGWPEINRTRQVTFWSGHIRTFGPLPPEANIEHGAVLPEPDDLKTGCGQLGNQHLTGADWDVLR